MVPDIGFPQGGYRPEGVVQNVAVEVAVEVVIEKHGMGAVAFVGESVFGGFFGKGGRLAGLAAVVDKQLVLAVVAFDVAGIADVDIEPAIAVNVGHGHAGAPGPGAADPGRFGDIFEFKLAFVEEKLVFRAIGGQV